MRYLSVAAKGREKAYKPRDSDGLYLLVTPSGAQRSNG
jgi:hypothetical protein